MTQAPTGPLVKIAPIVFSLFLGGVGGFIFHSFIAASMPSSTATSGSKGGGAAGSSLPPGLGGGQQPSSSATLVRTVRGLSILEKVQNKGLTAEQIQKLLPIAQEIQTAEKLPENEAGTKLAAVEAVLTEDQKQTLQELQPTRGGGRGGAGGGKAGGGGGMPGSGGGMGMAPSVDPNKPFAVERNKKALDDLIATLKQPPKS